MAYGTTAETNYEGNALPILPPGKYVGARLKGASLELGKTKDNGEPLTDRITINFVTADGSPFSYSQLKADTDEKEANVSKRIGHILSKFYTKDQLVQNNTSFESYGAWVVQMITNAVPKNQLVDFIITGSVYEGKARASFPNYPPFIVKTGDELGFDQNALKGNSEYESFMNAKPDAPAGAQAGAPDARKAGEF